MLPDIRQLPLFGNICILLILKTVMRSLLEMPLGQTDMVEFVSKHYNLLINTILLNYPSCSAKGSNVIRML